MSVQKQSWIMFNDRQFHHQRNGKTLCGVGGYALFEEHNPPRKARCKECVKKMGA